MSNSSPDKPRSRRRRFQFSLAALFALVLISSVAAWIEGRWLRHARRVKLATELAAPVAPLLQYVPYLMAEIDVTSGEYGRRNLALCLLAHRAY